MKLVAVLYFMACGYAIHATHLDEKAAEVAGQWFDDVARRWTVVTTQTKRQIETANAAELGHGVSG